MIPDRSHKAKLPLVTGFALLFVCAASAIWLSWQQGVADGWVRHTLEVENRLSSVQMLTARAENARHGLLTAGDLPTIGSYADDRAAALREGRALAVAVIDNPPQEKRAVQLIELVTDRVAETQLSMDYRRRGAIEEAENVMNGPDSRTRTARLLNLLVVMRAEEVRLLGARQIRSDHLRNIAITILTFSVLLILGLALLVSGERRRRLIALAEANASLESDIASRKVLEGELELARDNAEGAARSKATFLANMSHEIRTPMNGVIGFTELLLAGDLSSEQRRQADLIADSGRAMMRLLNDILDLSKVEAGQMQMSAEPFDLHHALKGCAALSAPAAEQRGIELRCEFAADLPKLIVGDGLRVRQIVLNLLGNAAKFTNAGVILLRAALTGSGSSSFISIEVEDTGIGIAEEHQAAIFAQFAQAEPSIAPRFGGTGLGLAISEQLAKLMGGSLSLRSVVGQGSTFTLLFPLRLAEDRREAEYFLPPLPMRDPTSEPGQDARSPRSPRLLVAEDHDINQLLIGQMLGKLGYRYDLAVDGAEAVMLASTASTSRDPYQLVLMDVQMPVMDGCEASRQIRANGIGREALPIIALTANAYSDDIAKCLTAGMQAHLSKPVSLDKLGECIRRWAAKPAPDIAPIGASRFGSHIQERYQTRKEELFDRLDELQAAESISDEEVGEVAGLLHKFAGSAEMFGDGALGIAARALELGLSTWTPRTRSERFRAAVGSITS